MSAQPNKLIISALALSGLVHGSLFFYEANSYKYGESLSTDSYISISLQASIPQKSHILNNTDVKKNQQPNKQLIASDENLHNQKNNELKLTNSDKDKVHASKNILNEEYVTQAPAQHKQEALDFSAQELKVLSGEQRNLMLGLLHDEISKHKKYPFFAMQQRREGLVTINFMLHPDGRISDISIVKSSRNNLLDGAARLAVEKVSPFLMAENHLYQSELFNVDIEFRLN